MEVWVHWGVFVAVFTTVALLLVSSVSLINQPKHEENSSSIFYLSSYISQMFLYGCGVAFFQLTLFFIIPEHIAIFVISTGVVTFVLSYFCLSSFVYAHFRYNLGFHKSDIASSLPHFSSVVPGFSTWFLMSCGFLLSIVGALLLETLAWNIERWRVAMIPLYVVAALLFFIYIANQIWYLMLTKDRDHPFLKSVVSIPGYKTFSWRNIYCLVFQVEEVRDELAMEQKNVIAMKGELIYPLSTIKYNLLTKPKNILVIVIDSWRFDALTQKITPNICNFSKDALVCQDHWSSGNTSAMGMMGLLYSLSGNYYHSLQLYRKQPSWMEVLQKENYETLILNNKSCFGLPIDKTNCVSKYHLQLENNLTSIDRNNKITQKTLDFLEGRKKDRPFFSCLYYCGSFNDKQVHEVPEKFKPSLNYQKSSLYRTSHKEKYVNYYYNFLHYTDAMIGEILEELQSKGDLENTCVVITADCGYEFNDLNKNYWGQYSNFSRFQTKVPCVIANLGEKNGAINYRTSHYDIMPSLMNQFFHVENSFDKYSMGKSLFDSKNRPYVLVGNGCHMGLVTENNIINLYKNGKHQYYDHDMNYKEFSNSDKKIFHSSFLDMQNFYVRAS